MTDAEDVGRMSDGGNNERGEGGGESRVIRLSSTLQSKLVNKHQITASNVQIELLIERNVQ